MLAVAHRGYSAAYPENTALSFERAIEAGADVIETDVRFTRDRACALAKAGVQALLVNDPTTVIAAHRL